MSNHMTCLSVPQQTDLSFTKKILRIPRKVKTDSLKMLRLQFIDPTPLEKKQKDFIRIMQFHYFQ